MSSADSMSGGATLSSSVYERLLQDVLSGRFEPGRKLRLQALQDEYKVGSSPLREALNRLSMSGMVVREENKGFRVSHADTEELKELIATRCWLEEIAIRQSIAKGDQDWEEGVVLAFHRLRRTPRQKETNTVEVNSVWEKAHDEFHSALIAACGSRFLIDFCGQLAQKTLRYRNLTAMTAYRDRHELDEHLEIHDAVLDRDADKAVELLQHHTQVTADIIIASGTL